VTPTVFFVDDEAPVRKAVERLLRSANIAVLAFTSAAEFLAAHNPAAPGCLLLDVDMPDLSGPELQRQLGGREGSRPIIFLSGRADVPISVSAMKDGAVDFLTKPVGDDVLLAAVRAAFETDRLARIARLERAGIAALFRTLTPREREVLEHVVNGKLNKQIAGALGTVEQTIKVHRAHVMEKMQVKSLAELVRLVERARPSRY
jgi:FixJ family two-component response regulator